MLPIGRYTLATQTFDVVKGVEERLEVYIGPVRRNKKDKGGKDGGKVAVREREGLRVDAGPQFTRMGGTTVEDSGGSVAASADISSACSGSCIEEFFLKKGWSHIQGGGTATRRVERRRHYAQINVAVQDPASTVDL